MQAQREGLGELEKEAGGQTRPWESSIGAEKKQPEKDTN